MEKNNRAAKSAAVTRPLAARAAIAVLATACSVVAPQIVHLMGRALGVKAALGETILPLHFSVLALAALAPASAAVAAALFAAPASFALTGMPAAGILPFIEIELSALALSFIFMKNLKASMGAKILAAQIISRALKIAAIFTAADSLGMDAAGIWASVARGLPGIVLQLFAIPALARLADGGASGGGR